MVPFEVPYSRARVVGGLRAKAPRDRSGQLAWHSRRPNRKEPATCPKGRSIGAANTGARLFPISAPKSPSRVLVSRRLGSLA
jgi:hypothetical protein